MRTRRRRRSCADQLVARVSPAKSIFVSFYPIFYSQLPHNDISLEKVYTNIDVI